MQFKADSSLDMFNSGFDNSPTDQIVPKKTLATKDVAPVEVKTSTK